MSLYTFAATALTTPDDFKRRPAVDVGQVVRTLALLSLALIALTISRHLAHAKIAPPQVQVATGASY